MPGLKGKRQIENLRICGDFTHVFSLQVRHWWGVPKVFNLEKKPRQSTDLEEYDFVVPKNFIELQVGAKFSTFEKSGKSRFSEKSHLFFLGKSNFEVGDAPTWWESVRCYGTAGQQGSKRPLGQIGSDQNVPSKFVWWYLLTRATQTFINHKTSYDIVLNESKHTFHEAAVKKMYCWMVGLVFLYKFEFEYSATWLVALWSTLVPAARSLAPGLLLIVGTVITGGNTGGNR